MRIIKKLPSQEDLKSLLDYTSDTGIFIWRITPSNCICTGDIAGNHSKQSGYIQIQFDNKIYPAHRLAWKYHYGIDPIYFIDHINGDRNDNRISNLREATNIENLRNSKKYSTNTSGFKGVSYHKGYGKWQARATMNGKRIHLGWFDTPEEASVPYINFTKLNFNEFYKHMS